MICMSQVKHPPQKLPDKNMLQKHQYEERYNYLKVAHAHSNDWDM